MGARRRSSFVETVTLSRMRRGDHGVRSLFGRNMCDLRSRANLVVRDPFFASLLLVASLVAGGCGSRSPTEPRFARVLVDAGPPIAVGDTTRVFAGTYSTYGVLMRWDGDVAWTISDATIARLEPTSRADERIARGLRVGTVTIQATIAGKSGQSPLHVVP